MVRFSYRKRAFTLAEVLITLVVIGVLSALVIPALMQNIQNAHFKAAYKKAFAVASQVTLNARQNQLFVSRSATMDSTATLYNFNVFMNQFSVTRLCFNNNSFECWNANGEQACDGDCSGTNGSPDSADRVFADNSGMAWCLYSPFEDLILVDTNSFKGPNRYGKDRWIFMFANQHNQRITSGYPFKLMPYAVIDVTSFSNLMCHYPPCYYVSWLKQ